MLARPNGKPREPSRMRRSTPLSRLRQLQTILTVKFIAATFVDGERLGEIAIRGIRPGLYRHNVPRTPRMPPKCSLNVRVVLGPPCTISPGKLIRADGIPPLSRF
jgi:hypothetical protein